MGGEKNILSGLLVELLIVLWIYVRILMNFWVVLGVSLCSSTLLYFEDFHHTSLCETFYESVMFSKDKSIENSQGHSSLKQIQHVMKFQVLSIKFE